MYELWHIERPDTHKEGGATQYQKLLYRSGDLIDVATELLHRMRHLADYNSPGLEFAVKESDKPDAIVLGNSGVGGGTIYARKSDGSLKPYTLKGFADFLVDYGRATDRYRELKGLPPRLPARAMQRRHILEQYQGIKRDKGSIEAHEFLRRMLSERRGLRGKESVKGG